jgi:exodeoxyribonuclease-3
MTPTLAAPACEYRLVEESRRIRIVAWNCLQGLARKAEPLLSLRPDVAVVPECGPLEELGDGQLVAAGWTGRNPKKGLGIFASSAISSWISASWNPASEWFLPVHLDKECIDVIGVWAMNHRGGEAGPRYGRTLRALQQYSELLAGGQTVVIGDFNSNVTWDTPSRPTFMNLVSWLDELGYASVYHAFTGEAFGAETTGSLFWQHKIGQPYLVDHAFVPTSWLPRIVQFEVGEPADWLAWSDHVPLVIELELPHRSGPPEGRADA